ncbi:sulfite exporter TauE/SafE family protein [Janthinobacterium sp. 17J80-10]|uniref:sulfite exporter TauE/SafE family protein n=1 Tax=Janthinobacterium sp. 17J80-10 TaxID=2497863 RepID=UPI001005363C|nr:sulfite exporter TauE/SafE family protein [Janthinobacterium sp. 17J80-10]QAU34656.1 sulfite exporter TauE/SafE family protein [Janthinobacterium sp. 17J80-10]
MTLTLILGLFIGTVLGMTGAGGAILSVPALVFSQGWSMQQAAPVALVAVAIGAGIGALEGLRQGLVRYKAALLMAAVGMLLTPLGMRLAHALPQTWLLILFSGVMLIAAARQLYKKSADSDESIAPRKAGWVNPDTGRFHWNWPTALLLGAIGALTGFLAGLLGVGGAFAMVPLLQRFTNISMHGVVATALMVTALVSAGGVASAIRQGAVLPPQITVAFAVAIAAGMIAGRLLSRQVSGRQVQIGFAAILGVVATSMLFKALG